MISFSIWSFDKKGYTLEDIEEKIKAESNRIISDKLSIVSSFIDIESYENAKDDSNIKNITVFDKNVKYILIKLTPEEIDSNSTPEMDVLIYEFDNIIKIIAYRGFNTANKILKQFFKKTSWGNISSERLNVNEDLLYWMFKLNIEKSTRDSVDKDNTLYIHSLKRYIGSSKDQGNTLTGEGDRISDILGTWAFLLDNDVKLLKARIIYNKPDTFHSLIMQIQLTGTLKFDLASYSGAFQELKDNNELMSVLSILITEFIMPILIDSYQEALNSNTWCPPVKLDFIDRISRKIIDRVNEEVSNLRKTVQQTAISDNSLINESTNDKDINLGIIDCCENEDINDDLDIDDIDE